MDLHSIRFSLTYHCLWVLFLTCFPPSSSLKSWVHSSSSPCTLCSHHPSLCSYHQLECSMILMCSFFVIIICDLLEISHPWPLPSQITELPCCLIFLSLTWGPWRQSPCLTCLYSVIKGQNSSDLVLAIPLSHSVLPTWIVPCLPMAPVRIFVDILMCIYNLLGPPLCPWHVQNMWGQYLWSGE